MYKLTALSFLLASVVSCVPRGAFLRDLTPTRPMPAATASDSVLSLAISLAVRRWAVSETTRVIPTVLWPDSGTVTPRTLPAGGRTSFVLMDLARIRELARKHGDYDFVWVIALEVGRDTAMVEIAQGLASREASGGLPVPDRACKWSFHRGRRTWYMDRDLGCLVTISRRPDHLASDRRTDAKLAPRHR